MAANSSQSGSVLYEAESGFCETSAFSSPTRLQTVGAVDVSGLVQEKINFGPTVQYLNDGVHDIQGVQGGSFTIELLLAGATSDTSGSPSASHLSTLLGYCVGNSALSASAGDTISGGLSSATALDTTGANGWSAGSLVKVGVLDDAGGDGQFAAVTSHGTNDMQLLTGLPAAPANGAVLRAPLLVHPTEAPAQTVSSMRFRLLTANNQYECRGCFCTGISFSGLNPGEVPRVSLTFAVAYWNEINVTFPATESTSHDTALPVAAGSCFYNTVGTATRATLAPRQFSLDVALGVVPLLGNDGNYAKQNIVGARRTGCKAMIDMTLDAEATGTQTFADLFDTDAYKHILYTVNSDIAFYFPRVKLMGQKPTQVDSDGLNRVNVRFEALTGSTTTSALTLSSWRLAMA